MMIQFYEIISKQCNSSQAKHFEIGGGFGLIKFDVDASVSFCIVHFFFSLDTLFRSHPSMCDDDEQFPTVFN